jgi:hypothetical protein
MDSVLAGAFPPVWLRDPAGAAMAHRLCLPCTSGSIPQTVTHVGVAAAHSFYDARGGTNVESMVRGPFPGGGRAVGHRYSWAEPSRLIERVA